MAIITEPLPSIDHVFGHKKATEYTRLVKTDIVRHGISGWTQTVQKKRIPHNPKTAPQIGIRCLIDFISERWWTFSQEEKDAWYAEASSHGMKMWEYYLSSHLNRWVNFQTPSRDDDFNEITDPISISTHTATPGKGFATLSFTPADDTNIYGLVILRSPDEITDPSWRNGIVMIPTKTVAPISYCDSPLRPGTYHYRAAAFNDDGICGTVYPDFTASVS